MLRTMGSWGLGLRSRMTQDESRGKAYIEDDGKLELRCIDREKVQDLGWPRSPGGRLTSRMMGSWDSVYRSQMDSVMWHWACNPQTVTLKELKSWCYIYGTGPVPCTGLSQTVAKELVTNELAFSTCESQSQDQDSPVPELSATTITFNPCEPQSQDQIVLCLS